MRQSRYIRLRPDRRSLDCDLVLVTAQNGPALLWVANEITHRFAGGSRVAEQLHDLAASCLSKAEFEGEPAYQLRGILRWNDNIPELEVQGSDRSLVVAFPDGDWMDNLLVEFGIPGPYEGRSRPRR